MEKIERMAKERIREKTEFESSEWVQILLKMRDKKLQRSMQNDTAN